MKTLKTTNLQPAKWVQTSRAYAKGRAAHLDSLGGNLGVVSTSWLLSNYLSSERSRQPQLQ